MRLNFARSADRTAAEFAFPPIRNESGTTLTLRLSYDDGSFSLVRFPGGSSDPGWRAPRPEASSVNAQPGDDLHDLTDRFGAVHLTAGTYTLDRPLVLNRPIAITADPGATVVFSQPSDATAWTAAIKIHHGHTTLDGFAVRFAGPIRWNGAVSFGPAVIGTTDSLDGNVGGVKVGLAITNMDLEGPPPTHPGEQAVKLMRLVSADSGRIAGNVLKGGTTQFMRGPWEVVGNDYRGTVANTFAFEVFAGHHTRELVLRDNQARPVADAGKTYRFLVLTVSGSNDVIEGNVVSGIGPMDADLTPPPNAPEIILTEAYRLSFEGRPAAVSSDGRIVQIPTPQGEPARVGDVVSVLSGPQAGQWSRIASVISPTAYVLVDPLPIGAGPEVAISIAAGFVGQVYRNNWIDARGSSTAAPLVLVGAHFGTQVIGNQLLGGAGSRLYATASEQPVHWGWSHTPTFDMRIEGNTFQDGVKGTTIGVEHSSAIKTNKDRLYFSAALENNVIAFSPAYLAQLDGAGHPVGLTIGHPLALDPGESRLSTAGNLVKLPEAVAPGTAIRVLGATLDGVPIVSQNLVLPVLEPAAPGNLALVHDSGFSSTDRITNDARLRFDAVAGAWGFEYRVGPDASGPFLKIEDGPWFLSEGLAQGTNTVWVRAFDDFDRRGPARSLTFTYDTIAPPAPILSLSRGSDSGLSDSDGITSETRPIFDLFGSEGDFFALFLGEDEVARREGPGPLAAPGPLSDGEHHIWVLQVDRAGNSTPANPITVVIDTTPPGPVSGLTDLGEGWVRFDPVEGAAIYEYRLGDGPFRSLGPATNFPVEGLVPGPNRVLLRAIDLAGNIGPESSLIVTLPPPPVPVPPTPPPPTPTPPPTNPQFRAEWVGQDGHDLVGPSPWFEAPDGIQDLRINLHDLTADRIIVLADVQGQGGGRWEYNAPQALHWKLAVVRAPGSTDAALFFQPYQFETGREYHITVHFDDGTWAEVYLDGGPVDPTLTMPPPPPVSAPGRPGLRDLEIISITPLEDNQPPLSIVGETLPGSGPLPDSIAEPIVPVETSSPLSPRARRALAIMQARERMRAQQASRSALPPRNDLAPLPSRIQRPLQRPWIMRWWSARPGST
ncbi:hypothetical protein BH23PLA1_BH23PLA1_23320 [soil metagenome]